MLHLLPPPRALTMGQGCFIPDREMYIVLAPDPDVLMRTAARQLRQEMAEHCGVMPHVTIGAARAGDISLTRTPGGAQGYRLEIGEGGVTIAGHDAQGVLHGAQTLRQIIRQSRSAWPCLSVEDAPVFPNRGFYHDQTRGRVATLDYLKSLADEMCLYKLNQLQLYVEHTYLFRDIPELWAVAGTPLQPEDIIELDDYCAARGIELVPSLSSFGHLLELLRIPRFSGLCELPDASAMPSTMPNRMAHHTIDPMNGDSFALIAAMIDEYLLLFRSDKFNICADETFDLGRGRNAGRDVRQMYMGFLKKLCAHVAARGKTPMFWGDIVLKYPEALSELPAGALCLNWGYSPRETEDATRSFAQAGAVQYVCPGTSGWNQFVPLLRQSHENIRRMAEYGRKYGAIGLLNTDWGDYGHVGDPRFSLPGMIAGACAAWSELPPADALFEGVSRAAYGDETGRLVPLMAELSEQAVVNWRSLVQHKEHAQGRAETHPLGAVDAARVLAADAVIARCCEGLRAIRHPLAARLRIAAEAIHLLNHAGLCIAQGRRDAAISRQLLAWLPRCEAMWRETSRESELWRVRDVVIWCAATVGE